MEKDTIIKLGLDKEMFFSDPRKEMLYFEQRLQKIEKYDSESLKDFAKRILKKRYIKALAIIPNNYETSSLIDVYNDILSILGVDDYTLECEIEDYRKTHEMPKEDIEITRRVK